MISSPTPWDCSLFSDLTRLYSETCFSPEGRALAWDDCVSSSALFDSLPDVSVKLSCLCWFHTQFLVSINCWLIAILDNSVEHKMLHGLIQVHSGPFAAFVFEASIFVFF